MPNLEELSGIINILKENPQIINSVASALGGEASANQAKPESSDAQTPLSAEVTANIADKLPDMVSALAPLLSSKSPEHHDNKGSTYDHKTALLYALRPYLSPERREIVDYILKFSKIGDLIKKLK